MVHLYIDRFRVKQLQVIAISKNVKERVRLGKNLNFAAQHL